MALGRGGRHRPHPHRRGVQTLGRPRLPPSAPLPRLPHPRQQAADRSHAHDAAGPRRSSVRTRPLTQQRPQHDPALTRDLPARSPPKRRCDQPHPQTNPPPTPRTARSDRRAHRDRTTPRRPRARRPRDLRNRDLSRTPSRRTPSPPMGRHRPHQQPHPHHEKLGPPNRLRRTKKPLRQPPRTPNPPPPPGQRRTRIRLPQQDCNRAIQPGHPQTPHHQSLETPHPDRPPRMPPHMHQLPDRRRHHGSTEFDAIGS